MARRNVAVSNRRARQALNHPITIYDFQEEVIPRCRICGRSSRSQQLISPCQCDHLYHQVCMLKHIRTVIRRATSQGEQIDVNTIKCVFCRKQFHFLRREREYCSCSVFIKRVKTNFCNKHIVVLFISIVVFIITVIVFMNLDKKEELNNQYVHYSFISAMVIELLIILFTVVSFLVQYLTVKQIFLLKVYQLIDISRSSSSNSDQNIISPDYDIIVSEPH